MSGGSRGSQRPILDALSDECRSIARTLERVGLGHWSQPALGEWNLAELAAHLVGGVERIRTYLDEPTPGGQPITPVDYFRYDPSEVAPGVAARARERLAGTPASTLPEVFAATSTAAVERASAEQPDQVMTTFRGPMRLEDYLETRVLEMVVHHIDVCDALGIAPAATAPATGVTIGILEGLLGSSRPIGLRDAPFIRAATGRIAVDDPRFPVMG